MTKTLKDDIALAETWPERTQQELADLSLKIDRDLKAGTYQATRDKLRNIDEAMAAVRRGEVASQQEVEAVFAKHRRA